MGTVVFPLLHIESLRKARIDNPDLWTSLFEQGVLEYVDSWELLEYRVAMSPKDLEAEILMAGNVSLQTSAP